MATMKVFIKLQESGITESLNNAAGKLPAVQPVLDFSSIRRINPSALRALEELASAGDGQAVKIDIRGIDVSVYKVLKVANLAQRFSFVN